jgi:chromosome segregation ATPase
MATEAAETQLRAELERVEREIAELRPRARELRERLGNRDEEPTDQPERTAILTMAEELEAIIATLEERRDELKRRLGLEGENP